MRRILRRLLPLWLKRFLLYVLRLGPVRGPSTLARLTRPGGGLLRVVVPGVEHPVELRAGTSDVQSFQEVFIDRDYDVPLPVEPRLIVDVGANAGYTAVYFANRFPTARVIAVEPEAGNLRLLRSNCAPYERIRVVEGALWYETARLEIANPQAPAWSFRVREATGAGPSVDGLTMHQIIQITGGSAVDLLKIDVEGAEGEIFARDCPWLSSVKVLIIELHEGKSPGCTATFEAAVAHGGFLRRRRGANQVLVRRDLVTDSGG